jgi:hypothetical protein
VVPEARLATTRNSVIVDVKNEFLQGSFSNDGAMSIAHVSVGLERYSTGPFSRTLTWSRTRCQ